LGGIVACGHHTSLTLGAAKPCATLDFFRPPCDAGAKPAKNDPIMLDKLRNFVSELTGGEKHQARFAESDFRLAAAALLIHASTIDGDMGKAEREMLRAVLKAHFGLDDAATAELIDMGTLAEHEAVDLYHFTSLINRSLDEPGRLGIVEMMWEIVLADGHVTEFEDNLMWRAADLLGVSSRDRIALRQRIVREREGSGA
jgi:uncharacterized tellurite resistance protein B-like protein